MKFEDIYHENRRLTEVDWQILTESAKGLYVEVGTFRGASAAAAALTADKVITIDIYNWQPKVWNDLSKEISSKIVPFRGTSVSFVESLGKDLPEIDTLFIDGSHEYEYVMFDCEALVPLVKSGGIMLFHDHNPNNPVTGVYRAVDEYLRTIPHTRYPKVSGSGNMLKVKKL